MKDIDRNAPELRFPGFTEPWEQRKFGELYTKNTEKNADGSIGFDKTISVATMKYKDEGNGAAADSLTNYKVLRLGDIAFEGHTNKEFQYGRFVINDIGVGLMSPRFSTLRPTSQMPISFWKYYIHSESVMRSILVNATKSGTMMNELVIPELEKQIICVPSIEEQRAIGDLLSSVDNVITLHQRKCDELKLFKRGLVQQVFPQPGETLPLVRFSGFTAPWEQRKLEDLFEIIDTKHATAPISEVRTHYRMIRTNCIRNGQLIVDNTDSVTEEVYEEWSERIHLRDGDLVFTREAPMGESAVITEDGNKYFPGQRIVSMRSRGNANAYFFNQLFYADEFRKEIRVREAASTTVANFGIPHIKNHIVLVPSLDEQILIGEFFTNIDKIITLHQRKCDELKLYKKGLLQKMFI